MRLRAGLDRIETAINERLPGPLKIGALTLYWYSTRSSRWLDRLAAHPLWERWSDASILTLTAVQVGGIALLALAAVQALGQQRATALNDPVNTVAVPGLNAFMPFAATPYIVLALVVATVVHEGGHAVACRAADVTVEEWGLALLFGIVPLAGYVLPDEELDAAPFRAQLRVYSIGVFHNLLIAAVALGVLLLPVTAGPRTTFVAYFGWAVIGGGPPTAATVARLGVLTNAAFWLALLNANFGLLNALPISALDGGRVLSLSLTHLDRTTPVSLTPRTHWLALHGASVAVIALVVVAILGPVL